MMKSFVIFIASIIIATAIASLDDHVCAQTKKLNDTLERTEKLLQAK
jgi:archaellum component FlaG (FlaF/FlaG flagellin family)